MKTSKLAGSIIACGAVLAMATTSTADAGSRHGRVTEAAPDVTKVRLVRGGEAAKVTFKLTCLPGQRFTLAVEVIQDDNVDDALLDAYYASTKLTKGRCTGRVQRFTVLTKPEQSGEFSSPNSRLHRGPASETIGGDFNGIPDVTFHEEPVR
jgi:hypothetical protein